jgi:hypothetical protein
MMGGKRLSLREYPSPFGDSTLFPSSTIYLVPKLQLGNTIVQKLQLRFP